MKEYKRKNPLLSLCGLNCGLCPMFLGNHCGGCGNGSQPCKFSRCGLEHGNLEYCFECECYPCDRYRGIDEYDSFITHRHQKADLEKARRIGIEAYNAEQREKIRLLQELLLHYNDGRRKTFFSVAVNLLELTDIQNALSEINRHTSLEMPLKERAAYAVRTFQEIADYRNIILKLNRKKSSNR